ncbi:MULTISPECIES: hypothetical protein [unclassified Rickettsia]|uniref:hypothetical protein n=1 Tax=unclassified Rickettsia TaxID=114295 RepID=UPI003132EC8A
MSKSKEEPISATRIGTINFISEANITGYNDANGANSLANSSERTLSNVLPLGEGAEETAE